MGGGVSVSDDMKPKIHSAFQLLPTEAWATGMDCKTETELRTELVRLRQLAMACLNVKHDNKVVVDHLDIKNYKKKKIDKSEATVALIYKAMRANNLFKRCKADDLEELCDNFESVDFTTGQTVMEQGEKGDSFYIIESGKCEVYITGNKEPVATPSAGNSFGELALMYNTPRAATVKAAMAVKAWKIERQEYRLVLAHNNKIRTAAYKELLMEVKLHSSSGKEKLLKDALTEDQLMKLVDCMDEDECAQGTSIITEATRVLAVDREDFVTLLGVIDDLVDTDQKGAEEGRQRASMALLPTKKAEEMVGSDLEVIRTLGQGAFGRVKLVKHKTTGEPYALKMQSKAAIVENSLEDHVLMERDILIQLDHPFILKLACSYQDESSIYFVLELLIGGEVFTYLRKLRNFPEPTMKFYVAGVILGFEHMHSKKIAYRDLKPENLVLNRDGYCKIVDLGLAKIVLSKTWTLCGTPDYLAPEIILNEGHDKAVDYWALGVLMFELVAGMPPFYADDPMASYEKILSGNMKFPSHFRKYLTDVIRKLLKLCQSKRLGNGKGGCGAIKKHRFFSGFAWDDLLAMDPERLKPPIDINVKSESDASNFDKYDEDDEKAPPCSKWTPVAIPFEKAGAA